MQNTKALTLSLFLIVGCAGEPFSANQDEIESENTAGNQNFSGSGNIVGSGTGETPNKISNLGGNGGSSSPNMAGTESAGAGTAGQINVSNGGANNGTAGTSGVCIPKTCNTISFEKTKTIGRSCGVVDDGCGNVLDCGECQDWLKCGAGTPIGNKEDGGDINNPADLSQSTKPDGIPNICAPKKCAWIRSDFNQNTCITNNPGYAYPLLCPFWNESLGLKDNIIKPYDDCVTQYEPGFASANVVWCCKSSHQ
jgi:hypothetical protein